MLLFCRQYALNYKMTENLDHLRELITGEQKTPEEPIEPIVPETPIVPDEPLTPPAEPIEPTEPIEPSEPIVPASLTEEIKLQAINEVLGTSYATMQEAVNAKARLTEYDSLKETKSKYDELSSAPIIKFHNKSIEEFNNFAETTKIDDPAIFKSVKQFAAKEIKDPIDAMILSEIIKDPSLAGRETLLRKQIQRRFNTSIDEDLYGEELEVAKEEAELNAFNLEREGKKAEKEISDLLEKVSTNSNGGETINSIQEQRNQLKAQWDDVIVKNAEKIFKSIPVTVPKGKDKNGNDIFESIDTIELSSADALRIANEAVQSLISSGLEVSEENLINVVARTHRSILAENYHIVTSKIQAKTEADLRLSLQKEIHNPSGAGKIPTPNSEKPKDFGEEVLEKMKQMGIN